MSVKQEVVNFLFFLRLITIIIHVDRKACAWTRDKITGNDFTRGLFNACISFLSIYRLARARLFTPLSHVQIHLFLLFFQYYEMSYGLNVEMHKQVSPSHRLHLNFKSVSSNRRSAWMDTANRTFTRVYTLFHARPAHNFSILPS